MLPVRNKTTGNGYLRYELACLVASRSPAEDRGHTLTSTSSSLPFSLFLYCHSSFFRYDRSSFIKSSWFQKFYCPWGINTFGIVIGMLTSSRCQGSPKTRETQKQLVLGETGPPVGLKPQRETSTLLELWHSQVSGKDVSRKRYDAANQISEVKLLGRALIG